MQVQMNMKNAEVYDADQQVKIAETSDVLAQLYYAASKTPQIGKEEQNKLVNQAQHGDKTAQEKLTLSHLKLVFNAAIKKHKQMYGVPIQCSLEDLVMAGCCGLNQAINKYNVEHDGNASFTTYALYFINKEINQAYLDERPIRLTDHLMERTRLVKKISDKMEEILRRSPTEQELCAYFDGIYTLDAIKETVDLIRNTGTISLFAKFSEEGKANEEDATALIGVICDENADLPEREAMLSDRIAAVRKAVNTLPEREAKILRLSFGLEDGRCYTLDEIAQVLYKAKLTGNAPLTKERIRMLKLKAMEKLRSPLIDYAPEGSKTTKKGGLI